MPDGGPCRKDRGPVVAGEGANDVQVGQVVGWD